MNVKTKFYFKNFYVDSLLPCKMLALALTGLKSRVKFNKIGNKNGVYQLFKYLLSFCLHKINIIYACY